MTVCSSVTSRDRNLQWKVVWLYNLLTHSHQSWGGEGGLQFPANLRKKYTVIYSPVIGINPHLAFILLQAEIELGTTLPSVGSLCYSSVVREPAVWASPGGEFTMQMPRLYPRPTESNPILWDPRAFLRTLKLKKHSGKSHCDWESGSHVNEKQLTESNVPGLRNK